MLKRENLNSKDTLHFPKQIVFKKHKSNYLAVAVDTANWIVLLSQYQKEILQRLIYGASIGDIILSTSSESDKVQVKNLLSKIMARDFASKEYPPVLQSVTASKFLNVYLTNECNLRCNHCFMNSGIKMKDELDTETWLQILRDFRNANGECLTISGGEPLMREDFGHILKYAADLGINTTVLTNGTLWTKELIDSLSKYISEIQISIDGVDELSNSIVRGTGYYEKAVNSVVNFSNNGVRTSVATTFVFENLKFADTYQQFVNEISCQTENQVFFKLSKKILKGRKTNYSDIDNKRFYEAINAIEKQVNSTSSLRNFIIDHEPNWGLKNCGFGGLSIAANGDVYLCNRISEIESYGNVKEHQLDYFLNIGSKINKATSVNYVKPCFDCELKYICGGGCRIDDFNIKGVLNSSDNYVQVNCNNEFKEDLIRKMVESFNAYYRF